MSKIISLLVLTAALTVSACGDEVYNGEPRENCLKSETKVEMILTPVFDGKNTTIQPRYYSKTICLVKGAPIYKPKS